MGLSTAERAALPNVLYNAVLPCTVREAANYAGYSVLVVGYVILPALCSGIGVRRKYVYQGTDGKASRRSAKYVKRED